MCVVKGIKYSDILVKIWYLVDLPHDIRVFSLTKTLILSILDDILQWMYVLYVNIRCAVTIKYHYINSLKWNVLKIV